MEPSFEEPWSDGTDLTPAPEQPVQPEPGSMYVPPAPLGLIDPVGHPPINPNMPELRHTSHRSSLTAGSIPKADSRAPQDSPQADFVAEAVT